MKLVLDSLFALGKAGPTAEQLKAEGQKIPEFLERFDRRGQGFTLLPKLLPQVVSVKKLAERLKGRFKDIVVLGIGGSALGVTCLRDALLGPYWNLHGKPRLFVLDNLDLVSEVEKVIDPDETLFVVISKSGTTAETMAQFFYFWEKVSRTNFVFITDPEKGVLREMGREFKIPMLDIPENIGGRFSVLSPVGLFPAALLGINILELLSGAESISDSFRKKEFHLNPPFQMAAVQYLLEHEHGLSTTVLMPYSSRLYSFALWYAQLLAESLGKQGKGLTPLSALGVTDQHSLLQLLNEGPKDKLIAFIEVEHEDSPEIPELKNEALKVLSGVRFHSLMNLEKQGTEQALTEYERANVTLKIPQISAKTLGELFMLFECSVAFLGEYYSINAFDQPGVELGKKITKDLLSS